MNPDKASTVVKHIAQDLGFDHCGIAMAGFLEEEAPKLEEWLKRNYQGRMSYLENHFDKRLDPRKLVPGAKSVISLVYNYFPTDILESPGQPKVAKYAYGQDYHFIIKDRLREFMHRLQEQVGQVEGRAFVDSAPVHERAWAQKTGAGWVGKHSLLLNRQMGSFFFLAELIVDMEIAADAPVGDYCGTCTRCMDACPTDAIPEPYVVDGSRCISYLTIELREEIPDEFRHQMEDWVFGCDICQDVCPWNRFSKPHSETAFEPQGWETLNKQEWQEMTKEVFNRVFKKSAVKRTKFEGLKRNVAFAFD